MESINVDLTEVNKEVHQEIIQPISTRELLALNLNGYESHFPKGLSITCKGHQGALVHIPLSSVIQVLPEQVEELMMVVYDSNVASHVARELLTSGQSSFITPDNWSVVISTKSIDLSSYNYFIGFCDLQDILSSIRDGGYLNEE